MKKILLFILMIALVVSCAVSGIAFAGSSLNRDYDVTYDAKFTADATTQNPGYLVFDKPVSATNGTITMTMDVVEGTNLTGKFNFGFALLTSQNGNALTDSNSMAWYNSATTISGSNRNKGFLAGGNATTTVNASLYYNPSTTIKNGYSIKVEYEAPTTTTNGSITLSTKLSTATTWTVKKSYTSIPYSMMPQADNLYFAVTGWSDNVLTENDPYRSFVFANPLLTDGTTSTNIVRANNVDFVPYSNFVDTPDEATASYKLTWGLDQRTDQGYESDTKYNRDFVKTGVATVAQGYFGNYDAANLSKDEALVMEFTVNNYNITEGTMFGFGVMSPAVGSKANADPFNCDDFYTNAWVGSTGQSIFAFGKDSDGVLNVTGYRMTINSFPGDITYEGPKGEELTYNFKPSKFMSAGKTVKVVYTPYVKDLDGVETPQYENDRLGSLIVYTKDAGAIDYTIAFAVTDLGECAVSNNLYLLMYMNMGHGTQSMTISNYSMTTRAIDNETIDLKGKNVQTGAIVNKLNKFGTCDRKAAPVGSNVYSYYVGMTEIQSTGAEDGDSLLLFADKTSSTAIDKGYALAYYTHGNTVNPKLSSYADISFDVMNGSGLNVVLSSDLSGIGTNSVLIPVPAQGGAINTTDTVGTTTIVTTARPTRNYNIKIENGKAVLYNVYDARIVTTTPAIEEGGEDTVVETTKKLSIKVSEVSINFSDFYVGFYVETTTDMPVTATIDNLHVVDDPAVIGVNELDYFCDFNMGIPISKFEIMTQGDNSMVQITDRQHTLAVTNGYIVDSDVYSMLASDGDVVVFKPDEAPKGYHFDRWETSAGDIYSRNETVTIVAYKNLSLVAKYELDEHVITILAGGKITFYEGNVVDLTTVNAKYGDSVKLTADENNTEGYVFGGWYNGNDKITSEKVYAFDVTETYDKLEAKYVPEELSIQVINGTVMRAGDTDASNDVKVGYDDTIIATPNEVKTGWTFSYWEFNGKKIDASLIASDNTYTFEANLTGTLTAVFEKVKYNVTVVGGYVSVINDTVPTEAVTQLAHGDEIMITANMPEAGKKFDGWYEGDKLLSTDSDYAITVTGAINIEAKFVDAEEEKASGCGGFIAPPTSNGGNNTLLFVVGTLALAVIAVAIARRNRTAKASK